jgi:uncharacterized protein (UPF0548 family)
MLSVKRPSSAVLDHLLEEARAAAPSYSDVGATDGGSWPAGYRRDADRVSLGNGHDVFERAASAVRGWGAQLGVGIGVIPEGAPIADGQTVLLLIRAIGLWTASPCRIVYVREDAERFRFAYGTLPGHPEEGEVSFDVSRHPGGEVVFSVESFSRPADPVARIAKPLTRKIQRRVTRGYLRAIQDAAR